MAINGRSHSHLTRSFRRSFVHYSYFDMKTHTLVLPSRGCDSDLLLLPKSDAQDNPLRQLLFFTASLLLASLEAGCKFRTPRPTSPCSRIRFDETRYGSRHNGKEERQPRLLALSVLHKLPLAPDGKKEAEQ